MNSGWNSGGGFPMPQGGDFEIGNWEVHTPQRPIPVRPRATPVDQIESTQGRTNCPIFTGLPNGHGYMQEMPHCNGGSVQDLNFRAPAEEIQSYLGYDVDLARTNQLINRIAGQSTPIFDMDRTGWTSGPMMGLLGLDASAFDASIEGASSSGANGDQRPWSSNFQPISSSSGDFTTNLIGSQMNAASTSAFIRDYTSTQTTEYEFPLPSRPTYDLNSTPPEVSSPPRMTNLLFAPATPYEDSQFSALLESSPYESTIQEKDKQGKLFSLTSETNHSDELLENIVESFKQKKDAIVESNQGIDLNTTPQQKAPKRKKHRPKVIVEGKPKSTRKPEAQVKQKGNENPSGKRKYVRKKGLKESASQQADAAQETAVGNDGTAVKSCRRALNFDLEKKAEASTVAGPEELRNMEGFRLPVDSQASELSRRVNILSGITSAQQIGHHDRSTMMNQLEAVSLFGTNQRRATFFPLLQRQAGQCLPARTTDQLEHRIATRENMDRAIAITCQMGSKDGQLLKQQQFVFAEPREVNIPGLRNLELSRQAVPQSAPLIFANSSEARGLKRVYHQNNEQTYLPRANSMPTWLQQMVRTGEFCNSNILSSPYSETQKRKKAEKTLDINSLSSCAPAILDSSSQVHVGGVCGQATCRRPLQMNNEMLNPCIASGSIYHNEKDGLQKRTIGWNLPSLALGNVSREHQISAEQHSHKQREEETSRLQVKDMPKTACQEYHQSQKAPEHTVQPVKKGRPKKQQANHLTKKTAAPTKQSPSAEKFQKEQKDPCHENQQTGAMTRGSSSSMEKDPNVLDEIIYRLEVLNLNGEGSKLKEAEQNAIVPYTGAGMIVPYEGRKRKPRPKVDLDPETNRVWNLLMGKEGSGLEENHKDKEKWWEEEREVFHGRANSFIARMHLVQGDRRFSRWKGSVVDSVIGVFLTQNVSDHLSSSAFMSLAAKFPLKSTCPGRDYSKDNTNIFSKEPEIILLSPTDTISLHAKRHPIYSQNSVTDHESTVSWQAAEIPGTETINLLGGQTHSSEEEVLSSQESFDCSINESIGGIRSYSGSNSESEDLVIGHRPEEIRRSMFESSFQKEKALFQDLFNHQSRSTVGSRDQQSKDNADNHQNSAFNATNSINGSSSYTQLINSDVQPAHFPPVAFIPQHAQINPDSRISRAEDDMLGDESICSWPTASKFSTAVAANHISKLMEQQEESQHIYAVNHQSSLRTREISMMSYHASLGSNYACPQSPNSGPDLTISQPSCISHQHADEKFFHLEGSLATEADTLGESFSRRQCNNVENASQSPQQVIDVRDGISTVVNQSHMENKAAEPHIEEQLSSSAKSRKETNIEPGKTKRGKAKIGKSNEIDWDILRREVQPNGRRKERSQDAMDSLDYEAIRQASVSEISNCIKERGMNNMLAERIKGFLDRLVQKHGSIDLEWLRDVPPDKAKDYLLSIRGLGLKSVECVRLLTLHHLAFPVDTNVGRIAVRLGWVPLQPLPESLQLHLLELYPVLESIQKYLWPRLCKLDQRTLYELHYQLITFGKVFCTKSKPNCNACPMRGECRHFASAFASARLALPGPEEKNLVSSTVPLAESKPATVINLMSLPPPYSHEELFQVRNCEPIIEEPATPDEERAVALESDIEDVLKDGDEEIPTIRLNIQEFTENLQQFMQANNMELQEADMSKALVALNPEAASIPARKLKNVSRLRTEHQVYELPDDHPLLEGLEKRELDDPSPYLLAIWTPGETANSVQQSQEGCEIQKTGKLCEETTCFSCNSIREANSQTVRGTLLIPCRTAMRGSFPLNGTYFQVNEMFADHESSINPICVPRDSIWSLRRRTVYFGTSVTTIFKGLSTEEIQFCFWRGFVCVRGFDRKFRAPRPLVARLHFPASKAKTRK
ncbi:transcriptional activator DEMETER-like [Syzygium oleosum]|uniref:transcriptional activator DEMETER-like n=1 Tax=Syzygium oleosum TaxID=219896 RepID=UPI0011D29BAF|nr:transcriptional activator DEMETER-like [Syzygium oleosum]